MSGSELGRRAEPDVLLRELDRHLASLRFARNQADRYGPVEAQERIAATLRRLVIETNTASAADRARVRAAVHYFMLRRFRGTARNGGAWHRAGTAKAGGDDNVRVINELLGALAREAQRT